MARKRIFDEPDDKDRWLISYADLMTTMFAFFVVLYAVSSVQDMKFQQMSNSLGSAFGNPYSSRLSHKNFTCLNIDSKAETESAKFSMAA